MTSTDKVHTIDYRSTQSYECNGSNSFNANVEIGEKGYCEFCVEEMEVQGPKAIDRQNTPSEAAVV